jgi:uncharacterized protein (DUF111 family)
MDQNEVYEKSGCILFVQTDHISGEVIGTAIDDLYKAGACNVQVIPSITKKNRPGHLFYIDAGSKDRSAVENVIVNELGATGWHCLGTAHRHVATEVWERDVVFAVQEGDLRLKALIKVIRKNPRHLRPEHASCLTIREALREKGVKLSLTEISREIIRQVSIEN